MTMLAKASTPGAGCSRGGIAPNAALVLRAVSALPSQADIGRRGRDAR